MKRGYWSLPSFQSVPEWCHLYSQSSPIQSNMANLLVTLFKESFEHQKLKTFQSQTKMFPKCIKWLTKNTN